MVNTAVFSTHATAPAANTVNEAGGAAYARSPEETLAQFAATGCFNGTYYASAEAQVDCFLTVAYEARPEMVARTAVYCREQCHMKDTPALLVALLTVQAPHLARQIFPRVIDDARMLRNFVQLLRSGVVARRSLGSLPKRLVQQWLESRTDGQLFRASVGNTPSIADIIRMVHPKPATASRRALYAYLIGKPHDAALLPEIVTAYEKFKTNPAGAPPDVPMAMLTSLELSAAQWRSLALRASWQTVRMNLNTFARHGVFENQRAVRILAERLRNPAEICRARVMPYQLLATDLHARDLPPEISAALHEAMEIATRNVPAFEGRAVLCPDVSGSMSSPITGTRRGSSTAVTCVQVAALAAATLLRTSPNAFLMPFNSEVVHIDVDPERPVIENAHRLSKILCGSTDCAAPLRALNRDHAIVDTLVIVSDDQSWAGVANGDGTPLMEEWLVLKRRNPKAKMIVIDIQPSRTSQAASRPDILQVSGFSDEVFAVMSRFVSGDEETVMEKIERIEL